MFRKQFFQALWIVLLTILLSSLFTVAISRDKCIYKYQTLKSAQTENLLHKHSDLKNSKVQNIRKDAVNKSIEIPKNYVFSQKFILLYFVLLFIFIFLVLVFPESGRVQKE